MLQPTTDGLATAVQEESWVQQCPVRQLYVYPRYNYTLSVCYATLVRFVALATTFKECANGRPLLFYKRESCCRLFLFISLRDEEQAAGWEVGKKKKRQEAPRT